MNDDNEFKTLEISYKQLLISDNYVCKTKELIVVDNQDEIILQRNENKTQLILDNELSFIGLSLSTKVYQQVINLISQLKEGNKETLFDLDIIQLARMWKNIKPILSEIDIEIVEIKIQEKINE